MERNDGMELVGTGRTAEVFRMDETTVLKLFHAGFEHLGQEEWRIAQAIGALELPAPRALGCETIGERIGIRYAYVDGHSILTQIKKTPWRTVHYARMMGRLHARLHTLFGEGPPDLHARLAGKVASVSQLCTEDREAIVAYLQTLPKGNAVCHQDFHPDNILLSREGPVIIDWMTACYGDAAADVCRTELLLSGGTPSGEMSFLQRLLFSTVRGILQRDYWRAYRTCTGMDPARVRAWRLPMAAARLTESIPEEEAKLLEIVEQEMKRLGMK